MSRTAEDYATDSRGNYYHEEDDEEEEEEQSIRSLTALLVELASALEQKISSHIDSKRKREQFLRQQRRREQKNGDDEEQDDGDDEDYDDALEADESELTASLSRYASMQKWMHRVNRVLDPQGSNSHERGNEQQQQDEEEEEEGEEDNEDGGVNSRYSGIDRESQGDEDDDDDDDDDDDEANNDGVPEAKEAPRGNFSNPTEDTLFRDASPEQQAEMVDTMNALQHELQVMQQLQQQLASLEAVAAQQEGLQGQHLEALDDNNGDGDDDDDDNDDDDDDDDDDEPPSIGAVRPEDADALAGEQEREVAALEEKLRAVQQLQQMLETFAGGADAGQNLDSAPTDSPTPDEVQESEEKIEEPAGDINGDEDDVDPQKVAEILHLQKQLQVLQQMQQLIQLREQAAAAGDEDQERLILQALDELQQNAGIDMAAGMQDATPNSGPAEDDDRNSFPNDETVGPHDDGTDSEGNFNKLVDELTPEEAQMLEAKVAEYEQARADMFAQQEQLAQLRTEYAQLQDLERLQKEQDEQMQAAAQARSASSADPPSSDADATDEEREKEALLARLAALQEEHRRMEQEREDLLNQSREHQLREKAALFRQAQLLQQASRQAEDIERRERQQAESSNAADVDDIGGGVDALEEEDGEFDEEEARATLAYLENQHTVLQEQRHQLVRVISTHADLPSAAASEQLAKMRVTLSRIEDLINNVTVYHAFVSRKLQSAQ